MDKVQHELNRNHWFWNQIYQISQYPQWMLYLQATPFMSESDPQYNPLFSMDLINNAKNWTKLL